MLFVVSDKTKNWSKVDPRSSQIMSEAKPKPVIDAEFQTKFMDSFITNERHFEQYEPKTRKKWQIESGLNRVKPAEPEPEIDPDIEYFDKQDELEHERDNYFEQKDYFDKQDELERERDNYFEEKDYFDKQDELERIRNNYFEEKNYFD